MATFLPQAVWKKCIAEFKPSSKNKVFLLFLFSLISIAAFSQTDSGIVKVLTELSLDDLINLKVISASGSAQTTSEAPSTMTVITSEQIKERGYEILEDALRDVQGIDLVHLGGYAPTIIYFRGMYGAENLRALLMINGVPENNIAGSIDLAGPSYSLHNVSRIEIIWGPASAIYGANAFGGVINIITKKGGEINGAYYERGRGSFNTNQEKAMVGMKKNNYELSLAGSRYATDGPKYTNRDPNYTGAYIDNAWSFNADLIHTVNKFKTTLSFHGYDNPMSFGNVLNSATKVLGLPSQGYNNEGNIGILQEDVRGEHGSLYETYAYTYTIQEDYKASDKLSFMLRGVYRETGESDNSYVYLSIDSAIYRDSARTKLLVDTAHLLRVPVTSYSNRVKGELYGNYILSDQHKFFGGIQYYQDNVEKGNRGEVLDTNKYVIDGNIPVTNLHPRILKRVYTIRNNFGVFLQYIYITNFLRSTNITLGGRYDKNTDFTNPLSPHIAVVNKPNDKMTVKLMYGTAFRSPTVLEVQSQITTTGSKQINPEKVNTYEVNYIYNPTPRILLQLNGFDNELSNIYVLNSLIGGGFGTAQTLGTASIQGAEAILNIVPASQLSMFVNYTYQTGEQKDVKTGVKFSIPDLPNNKGNVGLTYHVADLFTITAIANIVGPRRLPHSNPYGLTDNYSLDGYVLGNLVLASKNIFGNHVSASINVRNAFNTHYLDPGLRAADGILYSTVMEQPGRNVLFKIGVNF